MSHERGADVARVIGVAAFLGALIGVFVRPIWTDNLIPAQILAGIVNYPADSVMPVVYLHPHSVLTQIATRLLAAGVSEWYVALVFSGLQAALGCAALAGLTLVVSRRSALAALFVPVLLLRISDLAGSDYVQAFHGHLYPNTFPVGPGVPGVVGMFLGLLAVSLAALEYRRTAAVLLGIFPAVHVGLALPFWLGVGGAAWAGRAQLRGQWRPILGWFAAGLTLSTVSVLAYLSYVPAQPVVNQSEADTAVRLLLEGWNDHTRKVGHGELLLLLETEVYTCGLMVALLKSRFHMNAGVRFTVWAVALMTLGSVIYTVGAHLAPAVVPWQVRAALVMRWLNVSSWFFVVAALGMLTDLAFERGRRSAQALLVLVTVMVWSGYVQGISFASGRLWLMNTGPEPWWRPGLHLAGLTFPVLIVGGAVAFWRKEGRSTAPAPLSPTLRRSVAAVIAVLWLLPLRDAAWFGPAGNGTCGPVLAVAAERPGTLLLGSYLWDAEWVQVRTRRPVLFEPMDVNILPFTPAALPRVAHILERVYGRTLAEGGPQRLDEPWPTYDLNKWREIAREFRVTDVLVAADLSLQLPVVQGDGECLLYRLPETS